MNSPRYILDSDVLITAKNLYYAFDICPGFWQGILDYHSSGRVFSIQRIKSELLQGKKTDELVQWVNSSVPSSFFLDVDEEDVTTAYAEVMLWVQRNTRFTEAAKAKMASGADGWLVAYAMVHSTVVITLEISAPQSKDIKIPDLCQQFGVTAENPYSMLRSLQIKFDLRS